jgi:Ca2+ transporting ATPase
VFNEINARKLGERDYNVFAGFFNNFLFLFIIILTIIVQYLLVQFGSIPVRCVPLTIQQHLICIGIGLCSLIVGVLIKPIPARWFSFMSRSSDKSSEEEDREQIEAGLIKSLRRSKSVSRSIKMGADGKVHQKVE